MKVVLAALLVCGVIVSGEKTPERFFRPGPPFGSKIIGGSPIDIEEWNSIVSLQLDLINDGFRHVCGGSILTVNILLSAAHCFEAFWGIDWSRPEYWRVRAASNYHASGGVYHQLSGVVKHPNFNMATADYDAVVLRLARPFTFSPSIGQTVIPLQDATIADGSPCRTAGWGATTEGGPANSELLAVTVQIFNQEFCNNAYRGEITDRMICAGWPTGGRDACIGDSGGPLIANGLLYGIVSWGMGCAREGYPGVFARVPALTNWIVQTANSM